MAGNQTNIITFSAQKSYFIYYINYLLKSKTKSDRKILRSFYRVVKTLIVLPPEDYIFKKRKLLKNQFILNLPNWKDKNTTYNFFLSDNSQEILQDWIETKFNMLFEQHMYSLKGILTFKNAVYYFIELYNFPLDSYDMLIKKDQRFRKKKTISENTENITSHFKGVLSTQCPQPVLFNSFNR